MVTVIGPRDPRNPNAINCTSRSRDWSQGLSPFFLGPCKLYGDYVSQNMENAWQYSKVYKVHTDANNEPTSDYFEWANRGWCKERADRYPMTKGAKPEYSLWNGEKLTYTQARRRIYIPLYSNAVRNTNAFKILSVFYKERGELILWDFDAYNHRELGMNWDQVIDDPSRKCGHGFVLAMMLEGFI